MHGTILLVEDDTAIATVITTALEDEGFSVDRTLRVGTGCLSVVTTGSC